MKRYSLILVYLITITNSVFASFHKGYFIDNKNGRTECQIQLFEGADEVIKYKFNGSKLKIKSSEIKEIGFYSENSSEETIIYKKYQAKYFSGNKLKDFGQEIWAYQSFASDKIEAYFSPFIGVSLAFANHRTYQMFKGFVRLASNDFLILSYEIENDGLLDPFKVYDKNMRKQFLKIIGDKCPEMSEKVEKLKYTCENFLIMVEDYSKTCN